MFLSVHDLHLLAVMLAVAAGLSVVFAVGITRSLRDDLAALRRTTDRVAAGDLAVRSGVTRADELGATAAALDTMIERLAAAEAQRRRDDQARRTLLAAIGHDLRTPLSALQAAVEALQDGLADGLAALPALHEPRHRPPAERSSTTSSSSPASKPASSHVDHETVDLAELADETIEAMAPVADGRARRAAPRSDRTASPFAAGPRRSGGSCATSSTTPSATPPRTAASSCASSTATGATVEVIDEGPGFDADLLPTAFDSFSRADPSRNRDTGGAGLGLAIAKGVIEAHGGDDLGRRRARADGSASACRPTHRRARPAARAFVAGSGSQRPTGQRTVTGTRWTALLV